MYTATKRRLPPLGHLRRFAGEGTTRSAAVFASLCAQRNRPRSGRTCSTRHSASSLPMTQIPD